MRETLTVLAGLLVLTLLVALIGPGLVDWRVYRSQIETRLSATLGVETTVAGGLGLRLLPSPRLTLGEVRIGGGGFDASAVAIEQLTAELALGPLARGEIRIADAQAVGATLTVVVDETGAVKLPARGGSGLPPQTGIDSLRLSRSAVVWREAGKDAVTMSPIAAEISAASLAGPWRIEAEVAGASVRVSTGVMEGDGRLRTKTTITGEKTQLAFDGSFILATLRGGLALGLDGGFNLSPGGAIALTGRVVGGAQKLDLTDLAIDLGGGAARLEGEGQYLPSQGEGALALRARRLDFDVLSLALSERSGFERALEALPGTFDLSLDLNQLLWRGEDLSDFALRGKVDASGLADAQASFRVAGALVGATGSVDGSGVAGRLNVKADDSRRVALALLRGGLDPALADLVAGLGKIDAEAVGAWDGGRIGIERLLVTGGAGLKFEGAGDITRERLSARLAVDRLDLNALPPAQSLGGIVGNRDLSLDIELRNARYRNVPPGSADLALRREGDIWRLSRLSVDGFGGVSASGSGALLSEGGEISGRVTAPRFEALAALAGPLLPDAVRQGLARVGDGLAGLDTGFRLVRSPAGDTMVSADGRAQAGRFALEGRLDRAGVWSRAGVRFDLSDKRQAFAALGLPSPQTGGAARLMLEQADGGLRGSLAGAGLSVVLEDATAAARLSVQAERPNLILPEGAARLLPDSLLDAHAKLGFAGEAITLDDLVVNLGPAAASGALTLSRHDGVSGRLLLRSLDLRSLVSAALGATPAAPGGIWSSARFGPVAGLGDLRLAVQTGSLALGDGHVLRDGRFRLNADRDGLRIEDIAGLYGGGSVAGRLDLRREGGLAQLVGRLELAGLDAAVLTGGAVGGRVSGRIEVGGAGESPARLIAGLSGAGNLDIAAASLSRLDPSAYARVIAGTGEDASESEADRLRRRLGEALDAGAWALGDVSVPFTLAGGLARLQQLTFESAGLRAQASGVVDLRALTGDLRLSLRPTGALPKGWPGDAPQVGVVWRGPLQGLSREADVGALANTVAARALAREIERVEAFEADARERAMHSRRLRAERETRENERKLAEYLKAEEERRLAEEKQAEEARRIEEARRLADEKRAEDAKRAEQAKLELEARRRAEAEERARLAAERAAAAARQQQPGPLILPGAPRAAYPDPVLQRTLPGGDAPPLAPPISIEPVPRPLSRGVQSN